MNCWKTINFHKQYGFQRILFMSSLTMVFTFLFLYTPTIAFFAQNSLNDNYFSSFIAAFLFVYPVHKLLHFLPVVHLGKKIKKSVDIHYGIFPLICIRAADPIGKIQFIFALIMPMLVINTALVICCFLFPHYVHYFLILFAYHFGMCVPDFIRIKSLWKSPKSCYVEENEDGIEILVSNVS